MSSSHSTANLQLETQSQSFGGTIAFYRHWSDCCQCQMKFSLYLPPQAQHQPVPVLYFLSGLTCTAENFTTKAGAQQFAAALGLAIVAPDTSPRGEQVPDDAGWDFGQGAGFYVDATEPPWQQHYRMYSYVTQELPHLVQTHFPLRGDRQGICGHSMGGHGALVCALRNPQQYRSVSAFAPIAAPMQSPWGQQAFRRYLGEDPTPWQAYDASELVQRSPFPGEILIDQGSEDSFLTDHLKPDLFVAACQRSRQALNFRMQPGYDHSYYFIATFIGDHLRHHAQVLTQS
ncbi:MAG: S-formylglutathione hydrolase [Synechococcales bacterium]|nr:S-formylglutathione hydrolase [Synechococcales bacterium]